ncbi:hypothetical protein H0B56_01125 [Haloechinothrix sp. YIM 98757]|uniref:Uncharacterized protein n=1 Tax=Haloechinothrix aidingensis TaxID=2752311 RepID=A0A838A3L7_9PSEU|nr:hypothetical protein [Haloechinothrix aidingensis]MBA0124140.1 hypothetical protein [Haloechinothrix aidingensis]
MSGAYGPHQPARPGSGRSAALAIGGVLLAAGIAVTLVLAPGGGSIPGTPHVAGSGDASTRHLAPLSMEPDRDAVEAPDGTPHIPACRLLPPGDVHAIGHRLHDYANTIGEGEEGIRRTVFDYVGEADVESDRGLTSAGSVTGTCEYGFASEGEGTSPGLDIVVLQPFLVSRDRVEEELERRYEPAGPVNGADLYEHASDDIDFLTHVLVTDKAMVLLRTFDLTESDRDAVLETVSTNLADLLADPEGPAVPTYQDGPWDGDVVRACPLLDNTGIREVTGNDAAPFATETIPVTSATTASGPDAGGHDYVFNGCRRTDVVPPGEDVADDIDSIFDSVVFNLSTRTFETGAGAEAFFGEVTAPGGTYQESVTLDGPGDQAFAGRSSAAMGGVDLIVRLGPVVFELGYDAHTDGRIDEAVEALRPLAERISDTLASEGY